MNIIVFFVGFFIGGLVGFFLACLGFAANQRKAEDEQLVRELETRITEVQEQGKRAKTKRRYLKGGTVFLPDAADPRLMVDLRRGEEVTTIRSRPRPTPLPLENQRPSS